jgi:DNA-binding transcriptional MocR family regulator
MAQDEPFGVLPAWRRIPEGRIDLSVGQPSRDLLPLAELAQAARHRFGPGTSGDERRFLQYGPSPGDEAFLEVLAGFLAREYGHEVDPAGLFVTNGVSQGLELVCSVLTRPGEVVLVEEPTYFLAGQILRDHGLELVPVPVDEAGMRVDLVEELARRHRPALLYCVTTHSNPSAATLGGERRGRLAELAELHDFYVVADEVYQLLTFPDQPAPPAEMWSFDRDRGRVIGLQTFSKILCPGMRLGWLQAGARVLERLQARGFISSGGGLNPVGAALAQSCLELDLLVPFVNRLRREYARRCRALVGAVEAHLRPARVELEPRGGYFVWLRFDDAVDVAELLARCQAEGGVSFAPGRRFSLAHPGRRFGQNVRLCFAYYDSERLVEGVRRIAACL